MWSNANVLSVNAKKLFVLFHRARKKFLKDHSLYDGDSILARVETCKFLGTFVHLTFKPHIQYLT